MTKGGPVLDGLLLLVVTRMCVPTVELPDVMAPDVSELTDTSVGHAANIGRGPVELEELEDEVTVGKSPSQNVIPSVVTVAPGEGRAIVSLPTTMLLGPMINVSPFGSVTV